MAFQMVIDCSLRERNSSLYIYISVFKGLVTYHIPAAELDQTRAGRYQTARATQFMCCAQLDSDYESLVPRLSSSHKP